MKKIWFSFALMIDLYILKFQRKRKLDDLTNRINDLDERRRILADNIKKAKIGKENSVSLFFRIIIFIEIYIQFDTCKLG